MKIVSLRQSLLLEPKFLRYALRHASNRMWIPKQKISAAKIRFSKKNLLIFMDIQHQFHKNVGKSCNFHLEIRNFLFLINRIWDKNKRKKQKNKLVKFFGQIWYSFYQFCVSKNMQFFLLAIFFQLKLKLTLT